jgi:hypothetical protein
MGFAPMPSVERGFPDGGYIVTLSIKLMRVIPAKAGIQYSWIPAKNVPE